MMAPPPYFFLIAESNLGGWSAGPFNDLDLALERVNALGANFYDKAIFRSPFSNRQKALDTGDIVWDNGVFVD